MTPPAIASLRHSQVQMEQEDKMEDRVTYGDKYMGCRDTGNTHTRAKTFTWKDTRTGV